MISLSSLICLERKLAHMTSKVSPSSDPAMNQSQKAQVDGILVLSAPGTNGGSEAQGHKIVCSLPILFLRFILFFFPECLPPGG